MSDQKLKTYSIRQLHQHTEYGWAVICDQTGAILVKDGALAMKLSRAGAEDLAKRATLEAAEISASILGAPEDLRGAS